MGARQQSQQSAVGAMPYQGSQPATAQRKETDPKETRQTDRQTDARYSTAETTHDRKTDTEGGRHRTAQHSTARRKRDVFVDTKFGT